MKSTRFLRWPGFLFHRHATFGLLLIALLATVSPTPLSAQPDTTTVTGTLYAIDGSLTYGTIYYRLSLGCEAPGGDVINATQHEVTVTSGALSATLIPNDTCPSGGGTYYNVWFDLYTASGIASPRVSETWIVPTSTPAVSHASVRQAVSGVAPTTLSITSLTGGTTKGDWIAYTGTSYITVAVCADGEVSIGATGAADGWDCATPLVNPMTTLGDVIYGAGSGAVTRLAGNTTATKQFLTQTGDGANSAAPAWAAVVDGDLPATFTSKTVDGVLTIGNAAGNDHVAFVEEATNPVCSAGEYKVWANSADLVLKKCENGAISDLDTGLGGSFFDLTNNNDIGAFYFDVAEIGAPANPAANDARLYAKDDTGTTKLCFKDSAGAESCVGDASPGGSDTQVQRNNAGAMGGISGLTSDGTDLTLTGNLDAGGGTFELPNSDTLPGTCVVGEGFMDTNATTSQRWNLCETLNTWVVQGVSGLADPGGNGMVVRTALNVTTNRTITGTANEIAVANGDGVSGNPTLSLPATIDLGGKTSFELPNGATPTTNAFGELAGDNNAWAGSRGAPQFYDGTADVYLIGVLAADTPTNLQVPKWNTGGTITWEDDTGGVPSEDSVAQAQLDDNADTSAGNEIVFTNGGVDFKYMGLVGGGSGGIVTDLTVDPATIDIVTAVVPTKAAANVWTGNNDFGGATGLEAPNGAAPTVNAAGEFAIDTTVANMTSIMRMYGAEELALIPVPIAEIASLTDGDVIAYDAAANEFVIEAQAGGGSAITPDPTRVVAWEEFCGIAGKDLGWDYIHVNGAGGSETANMDGEADHPCLHRIASGTTSDRGGAYYWGAVAVYKMFDIADISANEFRLEMIFRAQDVPSNKILQVGMFQDMARHPAQANNNDQICIEYQSDADTNWYFKTRNDTTETRVDSGVAAGNTNWHRVVIWRNSGDTANQYRFCMDACGSSSTLTTNVPNVSLNIGFRILQDADGTTSQDMDMDWVGFTLEGLSRW